jgi:hypothetical protein
LSTTKTSVNTGFVGSPVGLAGNAGTLLGIAACFGPALDSGVLYYDCTNYFFEIEQKDGNN